MYLGTLIAQKLVKILIGTLVRSALGTRWQQRSVTRVSCKADKITSHSFDFIIAAGTTHHHMLSRHCSSAGVLPARQRKWILDV
jgi:hypothetical protein